jgi:hypothetical protein
MPKIAQWRAKRQAMSRAPDLFDWASQNQIVSDLPVRTTKSQAPTVPVTATLPANLSRTKREARNV